MGSVYLGCPVDVRSMLYVERRLQDPNLTPGDKVSLESKYLDMKLKFDGYNTQVSMLIDHNKTMKNKTSQ